MRKYLQLRVSLTEWIYLHLLSNERSATLRHFKVLKSQFFEENGKYCNPVRALLRDAIQIFLTWIDGETITAMCVVDRTDLSTFVIK